MCIYFYIYIYRLLSLKYLPRPLLISNVDYVPRLWHRQLPSQSRTLLCKDQAHPRPLPSPKGPVTFCPLLTDAEAGQRKPWRPSSAPSFAACWGSHWGWGGELEPSSLGPVVGLGLQLTQHLLRMAERAGATPGHPGAPAAALREGNPSKGHQGHQGPQAPKRAGEGPRQ